MFIIISTYSADMQRIEELLSDHMIWVKENYDVGIFVASGRRQPWNGSVILARAPSRERLEEILAADPFFRAGAVKSDIVEVNFARTAPDFEALASI